MIDAVIARHGFIHVYTYFGRTLPVEQVARVDKVFVSDAVAAAPGPTFAFCKDQQAHVWLRYAHTSKLQRPIPHSDLKAIAAPYAPSAAAHPLTEVDWHTMYTTGLIFIEDPKAVGGWR